MNPQSLNPYVYVTNDPTSETDPSGMDSCGLFTFFCSAGNYLYNGAASLGSTAWNGVSAAGGVVNHYVVQPAANYLWNRVIPAEKKAVNSYVVQPVVNYVVKPAMDYVVVPAWNGYQDLQRAVNNYQNWMDNSVSNAWQGFAYDVTHFQVTDVGKFITGIGACVGTGLLIAGVVLGGPEVGGLEVGGYELATGGALSALTAATWAHSASEVLGLGLLLGSACVTLTSQSVSVG